MIIYRSDMPVDEYNRMRQAVGWKVLDRAQAQTGLDNSAYLTAAWDGDKPVGMARVVSDGGYMTLVADVMVLPEYQGKGVSKRMMTEIISLVKKNGKKALRLDALASNTPARRLYEKLGFEYRGKQNLFAENTGWTDFFYYELPLRKKD